MILTIDAPDESASTEAASRLCRLAESWNVHAAVQQEHRAKHSHAAKDIDPVTVAALVISMPGALLHVADLVDRIRKRKRAGQLIEEAKQLRDLNVTVNFINSTNVVSLADLSADQLLELAAGPVDQSSGLAETERPSA